MATYTCLLRICCLGVDVVSLFVSRSLPSNGSTHYIVLYLFTHVHNFCTRLADFKS
jgi:hypothetical protein